MSKYRPRPVETKTCKHCKTLFESNHKRTIYCSEPCRRLAFGHRHRNDQEEPAKPVKGNLKFSAQNVATIGASVLIADAVKAGLNSVFHLQPTNTQLLKQITALREENSLLNQKLWMMMDYINAQMRIDDGLYGGQLRRTMQEEFEKRNQLQIGKLKN